MLAKKGLEVIFIRNCPEAMMSELCSISHALLQTQRNSGIRVNWNCWRRSLPWNNSNIIWMVRSSSWKLTTITCDGSWISRIHRGAWLAGSRVWQHSMSNLCIARANVTRWQIVSRGTRWPLGWRWLELSRMMVPTRGSTLLRGNKPSLRFAIAENHSFAAAPISITLSSNSLHHNLTVMSDCLRSPCTVRLLAPRRRR